MWKVTSLQQIKEIVSVATVTLEVLERNSEIKFGMYAEVQMKIP